MARMRSRANPEMSMHTTSSDIAHSYTNERHASVCVWICMYSQDSIPGEREGKVSFEVSL